MLRGYVKSNSQYTLMNSKTRNGTFGLKGWVSSHSLTVQLDLSQFVRLPLPPLNYIILAWILISLFILGLILNSKNNPIWDYKVLTVDKDYTHKPAEKKPSKSEPCNHPMDPRRPLVVWRNHRCVGNYPFIMGINGNRDTLSTTYRNIFCNTPGCACRRPIPN
jgi:hypothetical protein